MSINLPEPIFTLTNPEAIEQEWISKFEADSGKTLYPGQPERLIIATGAYQESLVRNAIQAVAKSMLLAYAQYPIIDYIGELLGKPRLKPSKAQTTIRYSLAAVKSFAVSIPAGSLMLSNDGKVSFAALASATIQAGQLYADVIAECETEGTAGNGYIAGQIATMSEPIAYITGAVNITTSGGGADEENTDAYRARLRLAPEENSSGGKAAYKSWVLAVSQTIIDVAVITPSEPITLSYTISGVQHQATINFEGNITGSGITSGSINRSTGAMSISFSSPASNVSVVIPRGGKVSIYPLTNTGAPSSELKAAILAALNEDTVIPMGDVVSVLDPMPVNYTIVGTIALANGADAETTRANVNSALQAHIADLKTSLGAEEKRAQIISIVYGVNGVDNFQLTSPAADVVPAENAWANCTSINITVGS